MLNNNDWTVVENAGYVGEVRLDGFDSYKEAKQYIEDNYTQDEIEELHVEVARGGSYEH